MNICVVSSFEGDVEEFMSLVSELDEEIKLYTSDFEIGVVNSNKAGTSKVITMVNVTDMEGFERIMSSPKMLEWDKAHNNTDIIYSVEKIN